MEKEILINYAKLIAKHGLNVQKGQDVVLTCSMDQLEFIKILVEQLYLCGARKVITNFKDPEIKKLDIQYQALEDLMTPEKFEIDLQEHIAERQACRLFIESDDPDALNGIDFDKYSKAMNNIRKIYKPIRDKYDNKVQWCIAGVPSVKWAKKVFPSLNEDEAVEALWKAILKTSRSLEGDAIKNFESHDKNLRSRAETLNNLHLKKLIYKSKNGTDFSVELLENVLWAAGGEYGQISRIYFQPNIPTEECFTSPKKDSANGVVVSTKPLSLNGHLVENFKIYFKDGKAYKVEAKTGQKILEELIASDEGSAFLGEVALIPFHSPINDTGLIFYSTLYDENASCHLALGCGFENLMVGYENMTLDEVHKLGINDSMVHCDFMIGSEDMNIIGIDKDNKVHQIFINGDWAF